MILLINPFFIPSGVLLVFIMSLLPLDTDAQAYSLNEVIEYSQNYSPEAMKNSTSKENKYWQWRTYKSNYKPQLVLNTTLPSFQNNNIGVLQGDGSIIYRNINQSQSQISLSLEQNISLTGGKLFLRSDLSRFDNFNNKTNSYSGSPFFIGIEQPLFSFNTLKWMNRVEPLKYEESLKEYIEDLENIAFTTTHRYFYLLIAQINYGIAEINLNNATSLYNLGKEKFKMGKISKNELLQLKYGFVSSQKSISNADLYRESAQLSLSSYTGIKNIGSSPLSLPVNISTFLINDSVAIEKANEHSKRSIEFKRYIVEAQQELERAKRESSLNANLIMSYGTTNVSGNIPNIYDNTQSMKSLNFGLTVPILDWGRAKAIRKTAGANLKLAEYTVDQEKINFSDEIIKEIKRFRMLLNLIDYTKEADNTAAERFEIARLRYIAEDISLTEYNIALEEKDRAKQDYIIALRDYWLTFYTIRILTLYDFQNKRQI